MSANILEVSRVGSHEVSEALVSKRTTRKAEREEMEYLDKPKKKGKKRKKKKGWGGRGATEGGGTRTKLKDKNQDVFRARTMSKRLTHLR